MRGEFDVGIPVKLKKYIYIYIYISGVKSWFSLIIIRDQNDSHRFFY